jgi:EpsI family protein
MLGTGILAGLLSNWTRVISLIIIGQTSNMQSPVIADHENLGLAIFALYLLPMIYLGRKLETAPTPKRSQTRSFIVQPWWILYPLVVATITVLTQLWQSTSTTVHQTEALKQQLINQLAQQGLSHSSPPIWGPDYQQADISLNLKTDTPSGYKISIRSFLSQTQGRELIHSNNQLYYRDNWLVHSKQLLSTPSGASMVFAQLAHQQSENKQQVVYWFQVGKQSAHTATLAKLRQIPEALLGRNDASLITISRPCTEDCSTLPEQALTLITSIKQSYEAQYKRHLLTTSKKLNETPHETPELQ